MKRLRYAVILLLGLGMVTTVTSCSSSPEALGQRDAKELNRAINNNSSKGIDKATKHRERHLKKYENDRDKYFRYWDAYKMALE